MTDGYDVENRLSLQHDENSKIEEIMHCEFNEEHWNLEEINSNEIYILSTGSTYNSRNDNKTKENKNNIRKYKSFHFLKYKYIMKMYSK